MEIVLIISGFVFFLVAYVNVKVTKDIARSTSATIKERMFSYLVVWLVPLLGVFLVPKRILPRFYESKDGHKYINGPPGSGGGMPGGG